MFLMCGGIRFQIFRLQTEKARFPNWVRVLTTTAALVVAEGNCCRRPESPLLKFHNICYWDIPRRVDVQLS